MPTDPTPEELDASDAKDIARYFWPNALSEKIRIRNQQCRQLLARITELEAENEEIREISASERNAHEQARKDWMERNEKIEELETENARLRKDLERNTTPVSAQAGYVPGVPHVMPPASVYDDDPYICQKCGCYKIHYRLKGLRCPRCD